MQVKKVSINTDVEESQSDYSKTFYFNKLLEPGEKHTSTGWSRNGIWGGQHKAKDDPSEERQKELIEEHGCKAQSGEVFVTKTWASDWEDNIVFSKEAGISGDTIGEFVVGSPNGMFPLQEKFRF